MGKKLGLDDLYKSIGVFPKNTNKFMERRLKIGAVSGTSSTLFKERALKLKAGQPLTTSVNKGSKLLNIGKKVFSKTPVGRAVNLAINVGSGIGIGYSYAKNKFNKKKADFQKGDYSDIKTDKKMAGGMMKAKNGKMVKMNKGGGMDMGNTSARTTAYAKAMAKKDDNRLTRSDIKIARDLVEAFGSKKTINKMKSNIQDKNRVRTMNKGGGMDMGKKEEPTQWITKKEKPTQWITKKEKPTQWITKKEKPTQWITKKSIGGGMDAGAAQGRVDRIREVYKLAKKNKGEDRLTQSDIKMAEKTLKAYESLKKNK